jgi:ribosome-binding factor A
MHDRTSSVNSLLQREISHLIQTELKDPRLSQLISIISVKTSKNLQNAKVYVSILGDKNARNKTMKGLRSASGFIQKQLRKNLDLKYVPIIKFILDDTLDKAENIFNLMDQISTSNTFNKI